MHGFIAGYYTFCIWTMRLAYLNILWVFFTLVGLIIFGFMPATAAMFAVVRKWVLGEEDSAIFKTFWDSYRKEFLKANGLGMMFFLFGYFLIIEFQILRLQESLLYFIVSFGVITIFILYTIALTYFFPIFVHFNLKLTDYLKWPFIIGIVHPILTLFMMIGLLTILYITFMTIPAILFFFGGSMSAYFIMWGASKTFDKYEMNEV
ncbi:YesL family protein [Pseudogracilibacillus auburnensis]|uniref:Putative membrane protein YesL n=1 Tax=Pseudogracilibacillus auburnensis TaxID=1494959 RepID=A0A2V3W1K1_9BACI|nr:YesL family protein [Pseudogracilibacillus auburnensis]PXW87952.1 putative membrane protein YesL [Pseudogracilibacillus auburnensis]